MKNDIKTRLDLLEKKLITPENFSVREYLNYGSYSVVTESDRELILKEFEQLSTVEQQQNLSILWALQPYRTDAGFSFFITCGKRTKRHELSKGRSGESSHLWGAVDITTVEQGQIIYLSNLFSNKWMGGFKHYQRKHFVHIDLGKNRTW
jgi:uncharacterized protein YcbK (DUF882 family)